MVYQIELSFTIVWIDHKLRFKKSSGSKISLWFGKNVVVVMNSILIGKPNGNFTESYLETFITPYNLFSIF